MKPIPTPGMLRLLRMRKKRALEKRMQIAGDYFMEEVEKLKAGRNQLVDVLDTHPPQIRPTLNIWKYTERPYNENQDQGNK